MRVRIGASVSAVRIGGGKGLVLARTDGGADVSVFVEAEVKRESGAWVISSGGTVQSVEGGGGLWVRSAVPGQTMLVNGGPVPGRVRLVERTRTGSAAFDVIEHVAMEEYLPGVVAKEMLAGWPLEAYRVQAVCARTYALHERLRVGGSSRTAFDVDAGERDQAYAGVTSNSAAIEAVRSTRGVVLMDGGEVLRAYYSSVCGGRSASAGDTWPTGRGFECNLAGPIQAKPREHACQNAPLYRWSMRRDAIELAARLRTFGERNGLLVRNLRELAAIEVSATNSVGRPSRYRVVEPGGVWYSLSAEQLRLACNQSGVRIAVAGSEGDPMGVAIGALPDIDRRTRVPSGDAEFAAVRDSVVGPSGAMVAVEISGRGFGHGVGMCQYCAKGFAERGESWRGMLERFYPGANVERAW